MLSVETDSQPRICLEVEASYPDFAAAVGIPRFARNDNLEDLRPGCQGLKVGVATLQRFQTP
jgi:hypothetical protein